MAADSRHLIRPDRLITLYLSRPLTGLSHTSRDPGVPILMYHSVSDATDTNLLPYYRTVTTPQTFHTHMTLLRDLGCEAVTLSNAIRLLQTSFGPAVRTPGPTSIPADRTVVITFDDGFRDFYTHAFPILDTFGFRATVFPASGCVDKAFRNGRDCLRTAEIRELARSGVEFGSHTVSHPQLRDLSWTAIVPELADSRRALEDMIGSEVRLFSYPFRFPEEDTQFTDRFASVLAEQGYTGGVTTVIGVSSRGDNPLFLRRLPVNELDDQRFFQAKLDGAYDWLHVCQLTYKRLRRAVTAVSPL
jgi:peptidoglycan/xylan/chitin deacetylase (PgdA/CDA1 family)